MTKQEIKTAIEEGTYMFNDNETWTLDFWEEAVEKCPELVEADFKQLNEFCINEEKCGAFELNDIYKRMFKNLDLD